MKEMGLKYEAYMPHPAYNMPERLNNEGEGITGFMYLKYNDLELNKPSESWTNFSLYRYAEVLLIQAEALNESDPGNAKTAANVNKVRARAGLPDVDEYIGNQEKFLGQNRTFDPAKKYLWPIPQNALDNNPNLTQNPNWQ